MSKKAHRPVPGYRSTDMAAHVRALEWASTPLGPQEHWPASLRTALGMVLASRYPMFLAWGPDLAFLYNDGYAPILGAKHPDALGRPFAEVWAEIWEDIRPLVDQALAGEATWSEDLLLFMERRGYVEETYYTFSYSPVPEESGAIGGMLCACTETTGRVIGERQLAVLREIGVRSVEARSSNEAAQRCAEALCVDARDLPFALLYLPHGEEGELVLAGFAGIEASHRDGPAPFAPSSLARGARLWGRLDLAELREPLLLVDPLPPQMGSSIPTGPWSRPPSQFVVLPLASGAHAAVPGVLVVGLNPFRAYDESYRNFVALVASQITASLTSARAHEEASQRAEQLAELDRAKTRFFSNVSHEFRTPLTLMLGPIEVLNSDATLALPQESRFHLEVVQRNALRLTKLVDTVLEFARIEAGRVRVRFEPVDLAEFTCDLVSNFRSACELAGLGLVVDCETLPEAVYVDCALWESIVLNLVSNAFKFTLQGSIRVHLGPSADGLRAVLRVTDTGVGIPAVDMPRLFERFHRVDGVRGRTYEGTGIGLALVQELVRLHAGDVTAESVEGEGTTFTVTIPLGHEHLDAQQVHAPDASPPRSAGARAYVEEALGWLDRATSPAAMPPDELATLAPQRDRVVWADDNADMREYVRGLLAPHFEVDAFADGEAALAAILADPPDVVLCDVMMPRLDGFGLLRAMRADPATRDIACILLSARAGEEARIDGLNAGASDYLVKPFTARELLARVDAHAKLARARREATERLQEFADTAPAMLWITEPDGSCSFLSRGWFEHTGQTREEALGYGWVAAVHEDDREPAQRIFLAANAAREPFALDYRLRGVDGEYRWAIDAGRPRFGADGRFLGFIGSVIDVHERKCFEQSLKEADRRKDEFLALLAHELRNPLAPIRSGLQILALADHDPETRREVREMMERQLLQLVALVNDLMDVNRITRGKLELRRTRVDVREVLRTAIESARPALSAAHHHFTAELPHDPVYLDADPNRLAQVVSNLLDNAAKYTPEGGHVHLAAVPRGETFEITVTDDGEGIPPEQRTRIFEMFAQVDRPPGRERAGLGLGLTLVKSLVEMHAGSVELTTPPSGSGSAFRVQLPLTLSPPNVPSSPARPPRSSTIT